MEGIFFDLDAWLENINKKDHKHERVEDARWWLERVKQKSSPLDLSFSK